jgi:Replication initiation factor
MNESKNPPPTTNRGVEKYISTCIDWVSATFKRGVEVRYHDKLSTKKTEFKPFNAYNVAVRYEDGRIELSHTTRKEMGTHVIASGDCLRKMPISASDYVLFLISAGATITRIDVSMDVKGTTLSVERARCEIGKGRHKTRSRECPYWDDSSGNKGKTQYIGKKSSTVFTRIYDKAKEMGIEGIKWTRVETVFQAEKAGVAAKLVTSGVRLQALIKGHVDFPQWRKWQVCMDTDAITVKHEPKDTNTQKWLLGTCAPALAREIHLSGDDDFYFRFIDQVKGKLEELRETFDQS